MIRTAAFFLVQPFEGFKVETVDYRIDDTNRIIFRNIFINSLRKKHQLVGSIWMIMYLWHCIISMPKDTKTLGYIKAPACESRGFVIYNKRVHHFDTPSCHYRHRKEWIVIFKSILSSFLLILRGCRLHPLFHGQIN